MLSAILKKIKAILKEQKGLTLVELLAAAFIFFAVLIPLVSVFIKGVEIYQETSLKTEVRNETDFIIGDVMRTIQDASYVKLKPTGEIDKTTSDLAAILTHYIPDFTTAETKLDSRIELYKRTVKLEAEAPATEKMTKSLITKSVRSFRDCTGIAGCVRFPTSGEYLVDGLFQMKNGTIGSAEEQRVTLYLVVSKRTNFNGQPLFSSISEIADALTKPNDARAQKMLEYIRVVRTEITLGSQHKG